MEWAPRADSVEQIPYSWNWTPSDVKNTSCCRLPRPASAIRSPHEPIRAHGYHAGIDSHIGLSNSILMNATKVLSRTLGAMLALALTVPTHALERQIYPSPEQASADIAAALKTSAAKHRRVILDFGGN